jgi:hypothetical protein
MDKALELEIKKFTAAELAAGVSLSDIQNHINAEFKTSLTYMDVRILASTLDVDWRSLDPNAKKEEAVEEDAAVEEAAEEVSETAPAGTVVEVSPIARPGMMFSGSVKFASGSSAEWYVDNTGRLGLENLVGDKPNENDVKEFQIELDKAIRKMMGQ